jgi:hypothetical protein
MRRTRILRAGLPLSIAFGAALALCFFSGDKPSHGDPGGFTHPGILVTQPQLDLVKSNIAAGAQPWTRAFEDAKTFPSDALGSDPLAEPPGKLEYTPHALTAVAKTYLNDAVPVGYVLCGSVSDPDVHCTAEKEDGVAAYTQALLWYLSPDGSERDTYGQTAIAILNTWAPLIDHLGFNAGLQAGWMGTEFARAAEIMQLDASWKKADVDAFKAMMRRAFLGRLLLVYPGVSRPGDSSYGQNGNWLLSVADSIIQIGVLLDDVDVFNRGIALWRDRTPAYCYLSSLDGAHPKLPCGGYVGTASGYGDAGNRVYDPYGYFGQAAGDSPISDPVLPPADAGPDAAPPAPPARAYRAPEDGTAQETCRDMDHVQYGLAAMMAGAETARIQGVDLYREQATRIVACLENAAYFLNGAVANGEPTDGVPTATNDAGSPPPYPIPTKKPITVASSDPYLCPSAAGKAQVILLNSNSLTTFVAEPTWEIGYNEYANRLGYTMPNTQKLVTHYRTQPPPGWNRATHHIAHEMLTHADVGSPGLPATMCGP